MTLKIIVIPFLACALICFCTREQANAQATSTIESNDRQWIALVAQSIAEVELDSATRAVILEKLLTKVYQRGQAKAGPLNPPFNPPARDPTSDDQLSRQLEFKIGILENQVQELQDTRQSLYQLPSYVIQSERSDWWIDKIHGLEFSLRQLEQRWQKFRNQDPRFANRRSVSGSNDPSAPGPLLPPDSKTSRSTSHPTVR